MISRHWKGTARPGQAAAYLEHLRSETFPQLAAIPGFVRASVMSRPHAEGTEFQVVTVWESLDAIRAFAGPRVEAAVVPPAVQAMMATYDAEVAHYEVQAEHLPHS
jgi:heme-degrading monooxygenase HmoA